MKRRRYLLLARRMRWLFRRLFPPLSPARARELWEELRARLEIGRCD